MTLDIEHRIAAERVLADIGEPIESELREQPVSRLYRRVIAFGDGAGPVRPRRPRRLASPLAVAVCAGAVAACGGAAAVAFWDGRRTLDLELEQAKREAVENPDASRRRRAMARVFQESVDLGSWLAEQAAADDPRHRTEAVRYLRNLAEHAVKQLRAIDRREATELLIRVLPDPPRRRKAR